MSVELVTFEDGRAILNALGGLSTMSDLAARWDVSRQRIGEMVASDDGFPEPAWTLSREAERPVRVWFTDEADEWRLQRMGHLRPDGGLTPAVP